MSKFFINRPIVAMVISIAMVILGTITIISLPVAQFPNIAPPEIQIQAVYVGADAQTLEQSVATPIEQQMSGVDNMNYMYSLNATANGGMTMIVDFDVKTDPNTDQILAQSRETQAASQLPADVNNYGITVQKSVTSPLMLITLYSPNGTYDASFLANYAYINIRDPLTRSIGIGNVQIFGAGQYAMRLWVKPDQLGKLGITVTDIINAIQTQNTVNPAGQVGGEPVPKGQEYTYSVRAQGRLVSGDDFGQIVVRETPDGGVVRVKDVARVELGSQDYSVAGRLNGKPAAIIAVYQLPGSNAVEAANGVKKLVAGMKQRFPEDMDYVVSLDTTKAVTSGIKEIVETLLIAIALVILVVYIFLQNWRATLIPMLAVPVALIGTFIFFPLFGFSINTLSLLGLVLAIGLVVDDAIVVVEGVGRHIEDGLSPKEAALKAMDELTGPVVGIALVLSAVFVPTAFIPGITGRLYQQFAVTIAISVLLSAFNALTLSPALSALLLRPKKESKGLLGRSFAWFNRVFASGTNGYVRVSGALIRKSAVALVLLSAFAGAAVFFGSRVPSSFLPDEDQGYLFVNLQLPYAASLQRTDEAAREVEKILAATPGVKYTSSVIGFSLLSFVRTSYNAFFFVTLDDWDARKSRAEQFQEIKTRLNQQLSRMPQGVAFDFSPPAIPGVGTSGGFTFVLEDRAGKDVEFLTQNLGTFMGGYFINYFNRFGRQWQVYIEAEGEYRTNAENVGQFYVRNNKGEDVPLSALTKFDSRNGPEYTMRFNEYRSAQIVGSAAPGFSSDQAMQALEETFAKTMPREMGYDYKDMSFQEKLAQQGVSPAAVFAFSLLFVFLILAALYESWSLPFSVLLSTPVAVFGAFATLWLRRVIAGWFYPPYMVQIENDVYSQIGLVMLIGLAAKNAILIVEFAKDEYEQGKPLADAALAGARIRLRPILMTSFAFILGSVPLWVATGAGSVARQIIGTTVIGGMLAASAIAIFLVPAIFYLVEKWSGAGRLSKSTGAINAPPAVGSSGTPAPAEGD
jgi:HAE1 family hydrophobic/amphiphilic exporter-1